MRGVRDRPARAGAPRGQVHLAAPGGFPRAVPRGRGAGAGVRDRGVPRPMDPRSGAAGGHLLRGDDRHGVPALRRVGRGHRGHRDGTRRPAGRDERPDAAGGRGHRIGVDHTEWLGTSRETIAPEKAGIFKPGIPAVVGEPDPEIAPSSRRRRRATGPRPSRIVAEEGRAEGVRVDATGTSFTWVRGRERLAVTTGLPGRHQATNAMVALAMLDALPGGHRVAPAGAIPALAGSACRDGSRATGRGSSMWRITRMAPRSPPRPCLPCPPCVPRWRC
jgi:hypothetical protein